jgi:hypothetical protein
MHRLVPCLALSGALALPLAAAQAEESCHVTGTMMSRAAITQSLQSQGYTRIRGLSTHNGCYEAKGLDKNGRHFELEVNGVTGAIRRAE